MLLKAKTAVIAVFYFWAYVLSATTQLQQPTKLCLPDLVYDKHVVQGYLQNNIPLSPSERSTLCVLIQMSPLPKPELELLCDNEFKYQALKHIKALIQHEQHQRKTSFFSQLRVLKEHTCS